MHPCKYFIKIRRQRFNEGRT